jgi:hypothetical protein
VSNLLPRNGRIPQAPSSTSPVPPPAREQVTHLLGDHQVLGGNEELSGDAHQRGPHEYEAHDAMYWNRMNPADASPTPQCDQPGQMIRHVQRGGGTGDILMSRHKKRLELARQPRGHVGELLPRCLSQRDEDRPHVIPSLLARRALALGHQVEELVQR